MLKKNPKGFNKKKKKLKDELKKKLFGIVIKLDSMGQL
jgi:uncharacterized protein (DUF302 family)